MKENELKEQARLQKIFDEFTKAGSWLIWTNYDSESLDFGVIDEWEVTRVLEVKQGKFYFWLHFRIPGFQEEDHYAHTLLITSMNQDDGFEMDLTDSEDRRYHIEHLVGGVDPEYRVKQWERWSKFVVDNQGMVQKARASVRAEHLEIANEWTAIP
jgi:hypothetical protein